jgi:hypothetical protein
VASACGGNSPHAADPTTLPAPPSSALTTVTLPANTTTTAPNPATIPPTITVAYVNAVLAQLNQVYGDAERIELTTRALPKSIPRLLRAIYEDPQYNRELYVFSEALLSPKISDAKPNPGDRSSRVTALRPSTLSCIDVKTATSYAPVISPPPPIEVLYFVLRPKAPSNDPTHVNRTAWDISYEMSFAPSGPDAC